MKCPFPGCDREFEPPSHKRPGAYFCDNKKPPHKVKYSGDNEPLTLVESSPKTTTVETTPVTTTEKKPQKIRIDPSNTITIEKKPVDSNSNSLGGAMGLRRIQKVNSTSPNNTTPKVNNTTPKSSGSVLNRWTGQSNAEVKPKQATDVGESTQKGILERFNGVKLSDVIEIQGKRKEKGDWTGSEKLTEPKGEGNWKWAATMIYQPKGAMEIPGTNFSDICPSQPFVNRRIVEDKIKAGIAGTPLMPAIQTKDGKIVLMDNHHLFVACMALGKPVKLALTFLKAGDGSANWTGCNWKGFEKPKNASAGFVPDTPQIDSKEYDPTWKTKVPWRKDEPDTDEGRVKGAMKSFPITMVENGPQVEKEIFLACQDDPGLSEKLYETLSVGLVSIKIRETKEGSSGGDWNAEENTIFLDDNLDPLDMADMLIWEAYNAKNQDKFGKLQHRAHAERMDPGEYGKGKAKIEAETEIEYLEHLLARKGKESKISGGGQGHLDGYDKLFEEQGIKPVYSKRNKKEREQVSSIIVDYFLDTPQDAKAELPKRKALKSSELYAYTHIADTQNVKGVIAFFRDKLEGKVDDPELMVQLIRDGKFPDSPDVEKNEVSWAGKFYDILSHFFNDKYGLGVFVLSPAQVQVAEHEYTEAGATWEGALRELLATWDKALEKLREEKKKKI